MNPCTNIGFLVLVIFLLFLLCRNSSNFAAVSGPARILAQIPMTTETGTGTNYGYNTRAYHGLHNWQGPTQTSPASTIVDSGVVHGTAPINIQTNAAIPTIIGSLNERYTTGNNNIIHRHQGDNGRVPLNQWEVPAFAHPLVNTGTRLSDSGNSSPFMPTDCTLGTYGIADPTLTGGSIVPRNIDISNYSPNCLGVLDQVVMPIE
tara:strand:- start:10343 stop:10957 length:615 start_codon:yes stop_codon:yes gene_type:complete